MKIYEVRAYNSRGLFYCSTFASKQAASAKFEMLCDFISDSPENSAFFTDLEADEYGQFIPVKTRTYEPEIKTL